MNAVNDITAAQISASGHGSHSRNSPSREGPAHDNELAKLLEETGELPSLADENRLLIMPVDPYLIFSCWTIKKNDLEMLARKINREYRRLSPVLRFSDITGIVYDGFNANSYFDIEIKPEAGSCYITLWGAGRRYIADLGFINEYGIFYPVCRSNIAETPPGREAVQRPADSSLSDMPEKIDTAFTPGISSYPSSPDK